MDIPLSTYPIEGNDLMDKSFSTLTNDPAEIDLEKMSFTLVEEESAALWAVRDQLQDITARGTQLHENVTEKPTTVEPLATLISDENSLDSTTYRSLANDTASERDDSIPSHYTPPTPVSNSPPLEPARVMSSAPADLNSHAQPQVPRDPTAEEIGIIAQHLQNEWMSLNQYPSASNPLLTHIIMEFRADGYPHQALATYPMHYHELMPMPGLRELSHYYPVFSSMGPPMPPTYPTPPRPLPPPVSNKRTFEFIEPEVPESFVANPDNHGRWQYDRQGNRHYLNAPKTKRPRLK
ncbi:hypothetical protein F1880_004127 [Penicillium rolfsii]|nr:hypothetical protein F1880_004127 [Penicillium rolfsii]